MKIAIIGTGNVGSALGQRWAEGGHTIVYGTRAPRSEKVQALLQKTGELSAATGAEAIEGADVVVMATPWGVTEQIIASLGDLTGKIVIDATNPIAPGFKLAVGHTTSGNGRNPTKHRTWL